MEELVYRAYVTDALKAITENTARYAGGSTLNLRYIDMIEIESQPKEEDNRECAEIAADIWKRIRGEKHERI